MATGRHGPVTARLFSVTPFPHSQHTQRCFENVSDVYSLRTRNWAMSSGDKFGFRRDTREMAGARKKEATVQRYKTNIYIYPLDHLNIMAKCMKTGLK